MKPIKVQILVQSILNVNDGILVKSPELLFDYTKLEIYNNNIYKNHFLNRKHKYFVPQKQKFEITISNIVKA